VTPERWQKIEKLFHAVLERTPRERAAFLADACAGDSELRREVESLLATKERGGNLLEAAASDLAAEWMQGQQPQQPVSQVLGHFRILSLLGKGGMGEVWLAEDLRLRRKVALKLLPSYFTKDADRLRRFEQEACAASALNHPNILTIHEIGETDGTPFIAAEFIEGDTLRERITGAPMKIGQMVDVAQQVASALAAAHEVGIIHRDIKPENIMVRRDALVKVLDFGIAKLTKQQATDPEAITRPMVQTGSGVVMGTMPYMSPEQALGRDVDHRSDIFSLGGVLYEVATARRPFCGMNASETLDLILHAQPEAISHFNHDVPAELERIVGKCLEKDREQRYQSARELLVDLQDLERGGSGARTAHRVVPQPPGQRRRSLVALAVAVLVLGSFGVYLLWAPTQTIDSLAVLPFVITNADPDVEFLADGIPESIINSLSQLPHLKVMSHNSVFRLKGRETDAQQVGQQLGVRAVLTGRVAQRGETLAISIELVDARDNSQIWGQHYNRRLADVFAVQEEIAKEISEKLRLKLTGAERQQLAKRPTENLKAFQFYTLGRGYIQRRTREDLLSAIRYYERAIEEDDNYALAYAGLADVYVNLGVRGYIEPLEGQRKAKDHARKALELDENLAESHVPLGQAYVAFVPCDFALGDREYRRAIELSPSLAMAHQYLGGSLALQGRLDESLEEFLKARELDPLSPIIARQVALPYYLKRDYVRALELLRQANELGPAFTAPVEIGAYIPNRLFNEALSELEKAKGERQNDPVLIFSTGMVYAAQGKRAEALQIIKELEVMSGASLSQAQSIAKIYTALNEKEMALKWLERGLTAGAIGIFFKDEPVWDTINSDPRFTDLLRRMGLTL
jgi:serine/threonine protein kinase/tetratricopeptide (TPR) repeat protein